MKITAAADRTRVDLDQVDLFDAQFYATGDPHSVWAAMRARAPLHRQVLADGRAFYSVTRYSDACRVLGNHREFTSERGSLLNQLGHGDAAAGKMLVATDPPRHSELRRPLHQMFTGRALAASVERIRDAVRAVLAPAHDGEVWDLAQRATMLPMAVAAGLMDLPEPDWARLVRWTGGAAAPADPVFRVGSSGATLAIAHHELFEYFSRCQRDRAGTAGDDLIRHLMTMPVAGATLTREEVVFNCYSMLLGANATTPHTVSGTVLALVEHDDQYRTAAAPPLTQPLVEEGLRWTSPANSFLRHATSRVQLSGGWVDDGDAVAVWIGSANRDEDVFHDPYAFDITRADNRHIAFGHGPHYCLGASLARLTLRMFFEEAFELFEAFELAGPPTHLRSNFIAGLTSLPVRTTRRAAVDSLTAG
ncbi:cytochrome P450 [Nocardia sp. NBC_01499]|uniref:cytochrome P450 n=1 Tax=Nocardia sp. NBC_01499 TaxID=2903597 RepID=UPI0038680030